MLAYQDPKHEGNGVRYRTDERCIEKDCDREAGTLWSPLWCFECNVRRIDRIDLALRKIVRELPEGK